MEVKPRYKHTEVGIIPEDWVPAPLPNVIWFQEGPGLRKWQFRSYGLKVINVTNLQENGYLDLSSTERHISWEECERTYKHFLIDEADVVIASSGNSYCKTATVRDRDLPLLMNTSVIRFKPREAITREFMLIYLRSKYFKQQIDLMITGGAQPNFGPFHLRKVVIPLPPTKAEQEAIAGALSDANALIESLEHLVAKKRQVKLGAMQELLTGRKRLPGFIEKWNKYMFGDLFIPLRNASNSRSDLSEHGDIAYVHYGNIHVHRTAFLNPIAQNSFISRDKVRSLPRIIDGDLLMADASEDTAAIGKAVEIHGLKGREAVAGLHTMALRGDKSKLADGFKGYLQFLPEVRAALVRLATGVSVYGITKSGVKAIEVTIPKPDEQIVIARILSDMDDEITSLETKLIKSRQVKQGMMQGLLTGSIRFI